MQGAARRGVVEAPVEFRRLGRLGLQPGVPTRLRVLRVRAPEDVGLRGRGDLEGGDLLLLLLRLLLPLLLLVGRVHGGEGRVEHPGVFVAAVEVEHLLVVEFKAGALGLADHPHEWRVAEGAFIEVVERPAAA